MILRYGSRGSDVRALQEALERFGYDLGPPGMDGIFGAYTKSAVMMLQQDAGLRIDGIAGPETLSALGLGEVGSAASGSASATPAAVVATGRKESRVVVWLAIAAAMWALFGGKR